MDNIVRIKTPPSLTLGKSLEFAAELAAIRDPARIEIDFAPLGYAEPFGMLLAASELDLLRTRFSAIDQRYVGFKNGYLAHMGFFKAFGLDFGKNPGEAEGSMNYLPITLLASDQVKAEAVRRNVDPGDVVEVESRKLSELLCREADGDLVDTLAYAIRELMRNVIEHSEAPDIWCCAQHWPKKKKIEVAILDRGVGLQKTLSNNPHIDASDDKKAINYALMPAVSGKVFKGAKRRKKGPWGNSGFGLYMTSRIARNGGTFFVATGRTGMLLAKNKVYHPCELGGTALRMVIDTSSVAELSKSLARYREEGYEIQRSYREIIDIDPSSASLMLTRDFDLPLWKKLLLTLKGK